MRDGELLPKMLYLVIRGQDCSLFVTTPTTLPREQMQSLRHAPYRLGPPDRPGRRTSIVAVFDASAPKAYPKVALASTSTLSGSVVRTKRRGEGFPKMFCLVASSLRHLICQSSLQKGHSGSAEATAVESPTVFTESFPE